MHPKIAVVCGAHTELGKLLVRELVRHPDVAAVHALAEVDPRDSISIRPRHQPKLRLHVAPLDAVERTIAAGVPHADIAFCALGCGKKDKIAMGAYEFHKLNLDIPRRFVHQMFRLAVQRLALVSHVAAAATSRTSEFLRVKGELEDAVRALHADAGDRAPGVSLFKVPLLLTNMRDTNGLRGSITKGDQIKQTAALKLGFSPARAVHVRDLAKAMVADTFDKLDVEDDPELGPAAFRRRDARFAQLDGRHIVNLAEETRAAQRATNSKLREQIAMDRRVSGYARREGAFRDMPVAGPSQSSAPHSESGTQTQPTESLPHGEDAPADDSKESFMSGSPPEEDAPEDSDGNPLEEAVVFRGSPGPLSPVPSSEPRRFDGTSDTGTASFQSPPSKRQYQPPAGSVESLGQQLGRRLTVIRNNQMLADAGDPKSMPSSRRQGHAEHSRDSRTLGRPPQHLESPPTTPSRRRTMPSRDPRQGGEDGASFQRSKSATSSLRSPPVGSFGRDDANTPLLASPLPGGQSWKSPAQRPSSGSSGNRIPSHERSNRSPSQHTGTSGNSKHRKHDSARRMRPDSTHSGGSKVAQAGPSPSAIVSKLSIIAGKVIAATDRPSTRRREALSPDNARREGGRYQNADPPIRGNGDMRAIGGTTI